MFKLSVFFTAVILSAFVTEAWGQALIPCQSRDGLIAELQRQYGEVPIARGVTDSGRVAEILASKDGETWTLIVTTPDGITCFVASGEGWQAVVPVKGEGA